MDIKQAVVSSLGQSDFVVQAYLADIKPEEMLVRATPGANHLAWQMGHLIASECYIVDKAAPGRAPKLPDGFAQKHNKQTATSDDPAAFLSKEEYLRIGKEVRGQTLQLVQSLAPADFDRPVEKLPPVVKTAGDALMFIGSHWLMHAGQWAVIRRKLGRPPLF